MPPRAAKPLYRCSQTELYAASLSILNSLENHLTDFNQYSTTYNAAFISSAQAQLHNTRIIPDFQRRNEPSETGRILLLETTDKCLLLWRTLRAHIRHAFPGPELKPKLEAAGSKYLRSADNQNWEIAAQLLRSGSNFIANHTPQLIASGMPPAFPDTYNTALAQFNNLYQTFLAAKQNQYIRTEEKILANNQLYILIRKICSDAQIIFWQHPSKRHRFVLARVLALISTPPAQPPEA